MFQYRQVLVRMRQGDTDREIARARLMGRRKSAELRILAETHGWLEPHTRLPEDAEIARLLATTKRASSTVSTLEPYRDLIVRRVEQLVNGVAIHAALKREHGYSGSYSSVYRMLQAIGASRPPDATVPLAFEPGEAAQVDFGARGELFPPSRGRVS